MRFFACGVKGTADGRCHIIVAIVRESSAEDDAVLLRGELFVAFVTGVCLRCVDGVERFCAGRPCCGIFFCDERVGQAIDIFAETFEVFVFDDAGVGHVGFRVVHDRVALEVALFHFEMFKAQGAVGKVSEAVVKETVDGTAEDHFLRHFHPFLASFKEVFGKSDLNAVEQGVRQHVVASLGDALEGVVEVVVVKHEPHGQSSDDFRRQGVGGAAPLLLGVAFDECVVDVLSDQQECLLLQVLRLAESESLQFGACFSALFFQHGLCFGRRFDAPHLVEGVHIERQVEEFAAVDGNGRVGVAVEVGVLADEVNHLGVGGVEDVSAVVMTVNAADTGRISVSPDVRTFVNDQAAFALLFHQMSEDGAEEPGTHNEIVVVHGEKRFRLALALA